MSDHVVNLPPNCYGITLPSGRKVNSDGAGHVRLSDGELRAVRGSETFKRGLIGSGAAYLRSGPAARDRTCCGRTMWEWETACPRCGRSPGEEGER